MKDILIMGIDYLNEVLLSIHEDKVPVKGTFIWSYIDNLCVSFLLERGNTDII